MNVSAAYQFAVSGGCADNDVGSGTMVIASGGGALKIGEKKQSANLAASQNKQVNIAGAPGDDENKERHQMQYLIHNYLKKGDDSHSRDRSGGGGHNGRLSLSPNPLTNNGI